LGLGNLIEELKELAEMAAFLAMFFLITAYSAIPPAMPSSFSSGLYFGAGGMELGKIWYSSTRKVQRTESTSTWNFTSTTSRFLLHDSNFGLYRGVCRNESFCGNFEDKFAWLTDPATLDKLVTGERAVVRGVKCQWWNLSIPAAKFNHSLCIDTEKRLPVRLAVQQDACVFPGMNGSGYPVVTIVQDFVAPFVVGEASVNASSVALPPQCSPEYIASLCPAPQQNTTAMIELFLAHPNSTFDVVDQDMGDSLGEYEYRLAGFPWVVYVCSGACVCVCVVAVCVAGEDVIVIHCCCT
jgi:hypothetical protein